MTDQDKEARQRELLSQMLPPTEEMLQNLCERLGLYEKVKAHPLGILAAQVPQIAGAIVEALLYAQVLKLLANSVRALGELDGPPTEEMLDAISVAPEEQELALSAATAYALAQLTHVELSVERLFELAQQSRQPKVTSSDATVH